MKSLGVFVCQYIHVYMYRIAGNVCSNYILRFVVNNEVCGYIVCGLLDTIYTGNNYNTYYTA